MTLKRFKNRIACKLLIYVGCILLVLCGLYLIWANHILEEDYIREVTVGGVRLSDSIKQSFRFAMLRNDREATHHSVNAVGELEEIEALRIYNKDGVIVFSSDDSELNKNVDMSAESCAPCHQHSKPSPHLTDFERVNIYHHPNGDRTLLLINPIYNDPDCYRSPCHVHPSDQRVLGVMDLSLSLKMHDQQIRIYRWKMIIFVGGLLAAVSMVIVMFFRHVVSRRIDDLIEGTYKIASGDLSHRLPIKNPDEIGTLAKSFNHMTQTLAETRNQLHQSERLASLGRMSAGIAHEINNPLTGIMMYASMLADSFSESDDQINEHIEVILREAKRCREIIKGLLDFARQSEPNMSLNSLNKIISNTLKFLTGQIQAANINIHLELDDRLPELMLDDVQIQQVILNIILNAIDAMPDGGTIRIMTQYDASKNKAMLTVEDTGEGIDAEILPNIFEPFFSTKGTAGTGLGLAVSWGIIQQHGGSIDVQSEKHSGTRFFIYLPVKVEKDKS